MPRKAARIPQIRKDRNYAVIYVDGEKIVLGRYDSPEAARNYQKFLAEWDANPTLASTNLKNVTVERLCRLFLQWAETNDPSHYGSLKTACRTVLEVYSGHPVDILDSAAFLVLQKRFVLQGHSRKHCNTLVNYIRSMLKWGVPHKLVSVSLYEESKTVPPLKFGKTAAPETVDRDAVPDEIVERTLPHLLPTVADMVRVQRQTGMRPGELVCMRVGDIDCSGDVWIYEPGKHKNTWRGQKRPIPLRKQVQDILTPRMIGKQPGDPIFSPKETLRERVRRDATQRKSKITPSQRKRKERAAMNPKRKANEFYKPQSYGQSIEYAIFRANKCLPVDQQIEHWVPYQLRHSMGTEIVKLTGNEYIAKAVLGHQDIRTTRRYNHADAMVAENYVRELDKGTASQTTKSKSSTDDDSTSTDDNGYRDVERN